MAYSLCIGWAFMAFISIKFVLVEKWILALAYSVRLEFLIFIAGLGTQTHIINVSEYSILVLLLAGILASTIFFDLLAIRTFSLFASFMAMIVMSESTI